MPLTLSGWTTRTALRYTFLTCSGVTKSAMPTGFQRISPSHRTVCMVDSRARMLRSFPSIHSRIYITNREEEPKRKTVMLRCINQEVRIRLHVRSAHDIKVHSNRIVNETCLEFPAFIFSGSISLASSSFLISAIVLGPFLSLVPEKP